MPEQPGARLPAVLEVITPAGRSLFLLGLVCYLLDTFGGWPVFQLLWVVCLLLGLVAIGFALLPARGRAEIELSPPRAMAGDDAQVRVSTRSAGRVPVPSPLISVPTGGDHHLVRLRSLRRTPVEERIDLAGLRRGVVQVGPVTARRTDPLSLLRWDERWSPSTELLVLPRIVDVESLGLGAQGPGGHAQ